MRAGPALLVSGIDFSGCAPRLVTPGGYAILSHMLLTTCPNCSAQFNVQPEQLTVRQGRVMCGRCRSVFNAFQSLTRIAEGEAMPRDTPPPVATELSDVSPKLTDTIFLREEPLPLSHEFSQTDFESDIGLPVASGTPPVAEESGSAPSLAGVGHWPTNPTLPPPEDRAIPESLADNPLLAPLPGDRLNQTPVRNRWWIFGIVILLLGLAGQGAYAYRSTLTQSFPELRPAFAAICESVGCRLSWGREDGAIGIEASDLIETPGKTGRILLTATLVNRSTMRQDLPFLELKLTDNANQVILSRVLRPDEYLGHVPAKDEGLVPNIELYVNLSLELVNRVPASGYGVRAFYK